MKIDAPCKECPGHVPGCHGSCEAYKDWKRVTLENKRKESPTRLLDSYESSRNVRLRNWIRKHK